MISALLIVGGITLLLGIVLYVFSRFFDVKSEGNIDQIEDILPGINCGGCGYPSCHALAEAISKDPAKSGMCVVGGDTVKQKMCTLLDVEVKDEKKKIAYVRCIGGNNTFNDADYIGEKTCRHAILSGNFKACNYGCMGFGDCVEACPFDAIHMGEDNYPVVDKDKCTACGKCVTACPLGINTLIYSDALVYVKCSSKDSAKDTMKRCKYGCIACGACVRACPVQAITITDNLAVIDQDKCIKCGKCADVCPRKVIIKRER